jgi:hypothetical protein
MAKLKGNIPLRSDAGRLLGALHDINSLNTGEKERIYAKLLPMRLFEIVANSCKMLGGCNREPRITVAAPAGLGFARIEVRREDTDPDPLFFLDIADTQYRQLELSFCIINDPDGPRFDVDQDSSGRYNYFATHGRNINEEIRAMDAGLFPNQIRRGLRLFGEFFTRLERFADSLGMEMIVAEPLSYDNAIRYEGYGFDYITGKRLMLDIDAGFKKEGLLFKRLDRTTPFRTPGQERTVRGRSWAIHDGIMDEPWDDVRIYKMIGIHAGIDTFPGREQETGAVKNNE